MVTEAQREQQERREVLRNDQRLRDQQAREQTGTFLSHTHLDDVGGRWAAISNPHIVGQSAVPKYPELPANSPWHHDPVPDEPPLGYAIDAMPELEPSTTAPHPVEATGEPTERAPPSLADVERRDVGSPPSQSDDQTKDGG
jgi:hypothetical protein